MNLYTGTCDKLQVDLLRLARNIFYAKNYSVNLLDGTADAPTNVWQRFMYSQDSTQTD
jgi:hypothetical protein